MVVASDEGDQWFGRPGDARGEESLPVGVNVSNSAFLTNSVLALDVLEVGT